MISRVATKFPVNSISRKFASRTNFARGGSGHGDHGHHDHKVFEGPFSKVAVGGTIMAMLVGGAGIVVFACWFQNKKHGFIK